MSRTTRAVLLTLCGLPLVALPALAAWSDSYLLSALASFCQAGSLVLGGGHVVLPMFQASVVPVGWGATMPSCQAMAPRRLCRGPCSALRIFWVLSCHRRQGADLVGSLCWPPSSCLLSAGGRYLALMGRPASARWHPAGDGGFQCRRGRHSGRGAVRSGVDQPLPVHC